MTCKECNGTGEIFIIGNFKQPCKCQVQEVSVLRLFETESPFEKRAQPTAKHFPPRATVRFKIDYADFSYSASRGELGLVAHAGDCDPYPCPYVWLHKTNPVIGLQKRMLVTRPYLHLEIVNSSHSSP